MTCMLLLLAFLPFYLIPNTYVFLDLLAPKLLPFGRHSRTSRSQIEILRMRSFRVPIDTVQSFLGILSEKCYNFQTNGKSAS